MILASEMPTSFGNFGTTFRYNGHAGFREFEAGLSYARNLGTRVAAGIRFSHYGQSMPLSASRRVLLADVGSQIRITDKVTGGLQVTAGRENSVLKMPSASFPFAYRLLLGYDLSDKCYAGISWTYQSGLPAATEAGIHYQLHPAFFVRAGFTGIHSSVFAGAGLQRDRFRLLVSGSYHPVLGFSPSLSCQFTGSTKS